MIERVKIAWAGLHLTGEQELEYFLLAMISLFVLLCLAFFIAIMISRVRHIADDRQREHLLPSCEALVSAILFEDKPVAEVMKEQAALLRKPLGRDLLLSELLKLHTNLSGMYADKIIKLYRESGLIKDSYRRLRSMKWHLACKGIRELTQMQVAEAYPAIRKHARSRFPALRQEALFALVSLEGFGGLEFLTSYQGELNDWQQLNLLSILDGRDKEEAPDFTTWLQTGNAHVTLFAVRLITHFHQTSAIQALGIRLGHPDERVREAAVRALVALGASEFIDDRIKQLYTGSRKELKLDILKALETMGSEADVPFLSEQLLSEDYHIRLYSTKGLMAVVKNKDDFFTPEKVQRLQLQGIIAHIEDTRIHA